MTSNDQVPADNSAPDAPVSEPTPGAEPAADAAPESAPDDVAESEALAAEVPGGEVEVPAPEAALAEAERARDEYLDQWRRERAAFENFRRRATKERMDALDRGASGLVGDLLGVLDNFGFALGAAAEREGDDQLAKGVQMVHTELTGVLERAGLEEVPGVGATFDPVHHEAMLQVEADEPRDEPVVVEVLRRGYRFKGRVLRPASVKVAR